MDKMDEDDLEDIFVLERESGEPNADGTFAGPAMIEGMPEDLKEQLKGILKVLQKVDGNLIPDKRKRDDILQSVMIATLRLVASQYPTTTTEDEILLKQNALTRRQRMAILVRLGEKKLLQEACDHFSGAAAQEAPDMDSSVAKKGKRSE